MREKKEEFIMGVGIFSFIYWLLLQYISQNKQFKKLFFKWICKLYRISLKILTLDSNLVLKRKLNNYTLEINISQTNSNLYFDEEKE